MKKSTIYLFVFAIIVLTAYGCKKAKNPCDDSNLKEAYIIGFDQCTAGKQSFDGKGFVIVTNDFKDTLVTYNLPDSLYQFPPSHFANRKFSFLFPDSVKLKYKIHFAYRILKSDEKQYFICTADVLTADFIWFVKDRQIKILCIRK
ncbi:hypothetical protein [Daejeonella sp. H1SJ63]|uniref:hypothetical protein n=1 Tax=Daejeonella sp. H1SJ63 TaxID=3034145 RepID=UPI0023ED3E78|nr:hypothetical protein [Daejeonella sp. H1SJ63]